jgi:hypothetical protein
MSENFVRPNRDLEARISACTSALEVQNLLQGVSVQDVVSPRPEPQQRPENYAPLRRVVEVGGKTIVLTAGSFYGLDVQEHNLREDAKFWK